MTMLNDRAYMTFTGVGQPKACGDCRKLNKAQRKIRKLWDQGMTRQEIVEATGIKFLQVDDTIHRIFKLRGKDRGE